MAREPAAVEELRRALGEQLATFRKAADLTQAHLAQAAFCDRTRVAHLEKGRARADEQFWRAADTACAADGVLLAGFHELTAIAQEHAQHARDVELADARAKVAQLRHQNGLISAWRAPHEQFEADEQAALELPAGWPRAMSVTRH